MVFHTKTKTCDLKDTEAHNWGQRNLAKKHMQVFRAAVPIYSVLFLSLSPCCKHNCSQFLWHAQPNTKQKESTSQAGLSFPGKHNPTKHRFSRHHFIASNGPRCFWMKGIIRHRQTSNHRWIAFLVSLLFWCGFLKVENLKEFCILCWYSLNLLKTVLSLPV